MQVVRRETAPFVGALMFFLLGFSAPAATNIAGLYATGAGGTAGLPDLHYRLIQEPTGSPTNALITSIIPSSWITAPAGSRWLSPYKNANCGAPQGTYDYRLTFDLEDSGGNPLDPSTAFFTVHFAVDDWVQVVFNGNVVATAPNTAGVTGFGHLFSVTVNSGFRAEDNVLDFRVVNLGCDPGANPTGLLVSGFCSRGISTAPVPVPEPGTWALLGMGLIVVAIIRRRPAPVPAPVWIDSDRPNHNSRHA